MELNITKIIENKMQEMAKQRTIEKAIETTLEQSILKSIESVLGGYDFRCELEQKFKNEISDVVNDVGLTAYNQYIADTFRRLAETQMKEEIKEKVAASFENIFVKKREKILLSEIVEAYKSYLRERTDVDCNNEKIYLIVERKANTIFEEYKVSLELSERLKGKYITLGGASLLIMDKEICQVIFNSKRLDRLESLRYMNDFECLLASLYFNKTVVEMDMEEGESMYVL